MTVTVDWDSRIVYIPKVDTIQVQPPPNEVRELDLETFHYTLKALEASEAGVNFPDIHRHNTEVSIGGLTLARTIEIINSYTITFENDTYAVNLTGANSNILDVTNFNYVSVRSNNSAGMINADFDPASVADAVFEEPLSGHTTPGTLTDTLSSIETEVADLNIEAAAQTLLMQRSLGLMQENFYIDQAIYLDYQGQKLMTSGRMRLYDSAINVGTANGVIATYLIAATYLNGGMQTYQVTKT